MLRLKESIKLWVSLRILYDPPYATLYQTLQEKAVRTMEDIYE